jgi:hypothetical protein
MEIIGTFLAVLELVKQQLIRVFQESESDPIWVHMADNDPEENAAEPGAGDFAPLHAVSRDIIPAEAPPQTPGAGDGEELSSPKSGNTASDTGTGKE